MKKKGIHPQDITLLPEGGGWLLVEFGGESKEESDDKAQRADGPAQEGAESAVDEALRRRGRGGAPLEGPRVGPGRDRPHPRRDRRVGGLGGLRRPARPASARTSATSASCSRSIGYNCSLYGHFGQGCIHTRIDFDLKTADGVKHFRKFLDEAGDLVVSYGGSISGEHGDGQSKAALLPKMFGPELVQAFGEFKAIWDPDNKMNPHKVVDPYLPGENLRLGPHYHPPQVETHFKFPDDHGSFAYATERCVGVGECRKEETGTMCPSYMVTKEEMHSTRGRAHLLFEMLQGDPMKGGWKSETRQGGARPLPGVQGVPDRVPDERRHGHVQGRVPLALLRGPAPAAARLRDGPDLLVGAAGVARAGGREPDHARCRSSARRFQVLGGISTQRKMPSFAPETFKAWWRAAGARNVGQAAGDPLARHVQQPLPPADREGGRRGARGAGLPGRRPARVALLRPAALRLRHARHGQGPAPRDPRRARGRRSRRARRSSAWSRAAWPSSATS